MLWGAGPGSLGLGPVGLGPWGRASHGGQRELSSMWLPLWFAWPRDWDGGSLACRHQPWGVELRVGRGQRTVQGKWPESAIPINVSGLML